MYNGHSFASPNDVSCVASDQNINATMQCGNVHPVCGPVRVKVGVKDNQTTNTQVTAIMQDVGLRNYGEFNEPFFCNKAVLWAVDENGWALLACRSV